MRTVVLSLALLLTFLAVRAGNPVPDINYTLAFFKKNGNGRDSSASKNVHVIDTAFYIPQLNRHRRIWIYLPASYSASRKKYPVLYMHDGQNVFDNATSYAGEWGVDEALDSLGAKPREIIVVAIETGQQTRMSEYSPSDNKYAKAEGEAYVDFLVKTLRPYINKHYRTKKCRKYNFIAGSSMGGLISFYALVKYPNKFAVNPFIC